MRLPPLPARPSGRFALAAHLLLALALALALYAFLSPPDPPDCEDPYSECSVFDVGEVRTREHQLERIGGQALVMAVRFEHWAATWLRGRRLVTLFAAAALASAAVCARVADLLREEEEDEEENDAGDDPAHATVTRPGPTSAAKDRSRPDDS